MVAGTLFFSSCAKDGVNGTNGINGLNGNDGKDAVLVTAADQAAFDAADGVVGARLYDHVLNQVASTDTSLTKHGDFYRCKSCHGWDLLGKNGVLINKMPTASYPVAASNDLYAYGKKHNIREIFDAVKNAGGRTKRTATSYNGTMPDYSNIISDAEAWDLVKFIKVTAHHVNDFYDMNTTGVYPTGTKTFKNIGKGGDPVAGKAKYDAVCASCHGANGTKLNIYCKGIYLGNMFRGDPHEIQHKAVWGMPLDREHIAAGCTDAGMMPVQTITDQDIRNMMAMGQDATAFPGF